MSTLSLFSGLHQIRDVTLEPGVFTGENFLRDLPYVGPHAEKSVEAFKAAVREECHRRGVTGA